MTGGGNGKCRYCSPECQKADWQHHKVLCKELSAAVASMQLASDVKAAGTPLLQHRFFRQVLRVRSCSP